MDKYLIKNTTREQREELIKSQTENLENIDEEYKKLLYLYVDGLLEYNEVLLVAQNRINNLKAY